jgi:RND family efflux transporter MFP subunit
MRSRLRSPAFWLVILAIIAIGAVIVFRVIQATGEREPSPTIERIREERGVPVRVAEAEVGALEVWREYSGTVSGTREGIVRARSDAQISEVTVSVGQRVRRGQVLVRQAEEAAEARVRQAEATLRQAERMVERLRPLQEAGAISDQEWDAAVTQMELAEAEVAAARDPLTLTSPLAGTVTDVIARPGMVPSTGDPLVRVSDLSRLMVSLQVGAADVARMEQGQQARLPGTDSRGQVRRIALQADSVTRLVEVEVEFPGGVRLVPGMLATVEIRVASRTDVVQVPPAAIRDGAVWVVNADDRAFRRQVTVGLQSQQRIEVVAGLEAGEQVVTEGASLLTEGAQVRIVGRANEVAG